MLTWIVTSGYAAGFDDAVRGFFYGIRSDALTPVVRIITYMGNWQTIVGLCIVLLAVKPLRIKYGVPLSAGALAVTAVNKGIKTT